MHGAARFLLLAALALGAASSAFGQTQQPAAGNSTGSVRAFTINGNPQIVWGPQPRTLIAIDNESASAYVACSFGNVVPQVNGAGSFTMPPGTTRLWNSYPVPNDQIVCTSNGTANITVETA